MRAAHAPEDFYLNRITLPALAYGASMSGITVGKSDTIHSSLVPCTGSCHSNLLGEEALEKSQHFFAPLRPGLALDK